MFFMASPTRKTNAYLPYFTFRGRYAFTVAFRHIIPVLHRMRKSTAMVDGISNSADAVIEWLH